MPVDRATAAAAYRRLCGDDLPADAILRTHFTDRPAARMPAALRLSTPEASPEFHETRVYRILFANELSPDGLTALRTAWQMSATGDVTDPRTRVVGTAEHRTRGDVFVWDLRRIGTGSAWCLDVTCKLAGSRDGAVKLLLRELTTCSNNASAACDHRRQLPRQRRGDHAYRKPADGSDLPAWKEALNVEHRTVRAGVAHSPARMKCFKILRDYRRAATHWPTPLPASATSTTSSSPTDRRSVPGNAFTVTRRAFLKSMIPHHSHATLVRQEAQVTDPEIVRLCDQIVKSQQEEIAQIKDILDRL
ncbi:DUF305 domain-containing protein [Micromonospora sp. WMMD737]|uniref:DUF305 domain-containing protein n=1 Tax=Micromonospora sp. WMMD737 TaxID=3404113 RepID=UPI003B92452F